jgi:hypothetical protein
MAEGIVRPSLVCVECGETASDDDARGWRTYLTSDEPEDVAIYCQDCAEREFGQA